MKKYEEIMDKLEVTGEMKARILGNLQEIFSKNQMFSQNTMVFSKEKEVEVGGRKAVLKGSGEKYNLAVWTYGRFSYSIFCENGLSENEMVDVITEID